MISRMFAEFEQRKKQLETKDKEMKKQAQEQQAEKEFMDALKKKVTPPPPHPPHPQHKTRSPLLA